MQFVADILCIVTVHWTGKQPMGLIGITHHGLCRCHQSPLGFYTLSTESSNNSDVCSQCTGGVLNHPVCREHPVHGDGAMDRQAAHGSGITHGLRHRHHIHRFLHSLNRGLYELWLAAIPHVRRTSVLYWLRRCSCPLDACQWSLSHEVPK